MRGRTNRLPPANSCGIELVRFPSLYANSNISRVSLRVQPVRLVEFNIARDRAGTTTIPTQWCPCLLETSFEFPDDLAELLAAKLSKLLLLQIDNTVARVDEASVGKRHSPKLFCYPGELFSQGHPIRKGASTYYLGNVHATGRPIDSLLPAFSEALSYSGEQTMPTRVLIELYRKARSLRRFGRLGNFI